MASPHPSPSSAPSKKKKPRPAAPPPIHAPVDEDKMARLKIRLAERLAVFLQEFNLDMEESAQRMLTDWAMDFMLGVVTAADESATKQDRDHITPEDVTSGVLQACQARTERAGVADYAAADGMINKKALPKPRRCLQGMPNDVVAKNKEVFINAKKKAYLQKLAEERKRAMECQPSTSTTVSEEPSASHGPPVIVTDLKKDRKGRITSVTVEELPMEGEE